MRVTFLDYLILMFFSLSDIRKRNNRSHGKRKNGNLKRKNKHVLTLSELNIILKHSGRHMALLRLVTLSISSLRNSDIEANKFYDRAHRLYDAAILTRCYTQHALLPYIDSEINHIMHFIKIQFVNNGIEFINLPSIFKDKSVISSIPTYFENKESPIIRYKYKQPKRYKLWSCQKMCDALHYLLDNIFIRLGSKLYRQIVGIPMGTYCAPLVADLFLFCYERDFMLSLSDKNQTDIIEAFNSTSRYLDDLLNINNPYFEQMVGQIYPTDLQLNKANSSDTEAPFLDLNLSITNGIVSSKIYDKRDDFNFEIVNFPFLDGDVPGSPSYGVYISQLIRFARVCSNVDYFNNRNCFLTAKLLKQGCRYHKIRKAFSKFYHRHSELIVKYNIGLKLFCNKAYQNLYFMVI